MLRPSSITAPDTRAPGTVSCMRFKHRSSVDFPQPEGPMMAVTKRSGSDNVTLLTARVPQKNASRSSAARRAADASVARGALTTTLTEGTLPAPRGDGPAPGRAARDSWEADPDVTPASCLLPPVPR